MVRLVLVVEDDRDVREAVSDALESEGFTVIQARDGEEALARARDLVPSLILLDLMMPRMNGWEFRAIQAADPLLSGVPVVVVSAVADLVEELHPAAVLAKPFDLRHLLQAVEQFAVAA